MGTHLTDSKAVSQLKAIWLCILGLSPYTILSFSIQIFPSSTPVPPYIVISSGIVSDPIVRGGPSSGSLQSPWSQGANILQGHRPETLNKYICKYLSVWDKD